MRTFIRDNKGQVLVTILAIITGVIMGLLIYGIDNEALAVLGGTGNLSTEANNKHNLSVSATHGGIQADSEDEICIFCHTPHNAITNTAIINAPLWNHTLSSATIDFSGTSTNLFNPASLNIDGASMLCMSCHDGTVGVGVTQSEGAISMSGTCLDGSGAMTGTCTGYLGTAPTHHVFSVPVNDTLITDSIDNCIASITTTRIKYPWDATGSAIANNDIVLRPTAQTYGTLLGITYPSGAMPATKYRSGYNYGVQCSSCHDPHNYREESSVNCKFLVAGCPGNTDPLCTACHTTDCP